MKLEKEQLDLKNGLLREWIITNGIGGYSSSTVLGANTRKYHGLLVAPLMPPSRRYLILSKLDESLEICGKNYNLYTNVCKNYISDGYKYLDNFEKKYIPIFEYKIENVDIVKKVCMQYGRNTVIVTYKITNNNDSDVILKLAPIMNFRDFHCMTSNHEFNFRQTISNNKKVRLVIDDNRTTPIYMHISDGNYIEHYNDMFRNMYYIEEEKRGFYPEENHLVPGRYEVIINKNEEKEITFVCSLEENIEELSGKDIIEKEIKRLKNIVDKTELIKEKKKMLKADREYNELLEDLIISTDSFIIYRHAFSLHTIIAGYPWFLDWGRDAFISFEGLLLVTKRFDIAREVLLTFTRDIKFGLVPNGYSGFDSRPLYNSVDSSLLLFEQINKYIKYTGDYKFIEEKVYDILKNVVKNYIQGINLDDNNIYIDKDSLLVSGTDNTQNTWMDAKAGGMPVTPRNGKAVEINALWYNALKTLENLATIFNEPQLAEECNKMAKKHKTTFNKKFYNEKKKSLFDVLGDGKIRPNQLFSLSVTYPVIDPNSDTGKTIFETVKEKLLTKYGLKSLAKGEKNYIAIYEGDPFKRDSSYHQGITWVWLLGVYADSFKNKIKFEKNEKEKAKLQEEYEKFREGTIKTFKKAVYEDAAIGTISELYNSQAPFNPGGTISQAWSVSEILRIIL